MSQLGITSVIDLRSAAEIAVAPHPLAQAGGYRHRPLVDERAEAIRDPTRDVALGDIYAASLSRNAITIAAVMTAIAATPSGPLMICCAAGRDRTGMIAALLLDLAGATHAAIGSDYAMTDSVRRGVRLDPPTTTHATNPGPPNAASHSGTRPIDQMIGHVNEHFGGPQVYLAWLGLTSGQIDTLNQRLT